MAIYKSTDATDTAQLAIFIGGIDYKYNVTEEMAFLVPLKDTIKSPDLREAVTKYIKAIFFNPCQHVWYTDGADGTDGAPLLMVPQQWLVKKRDL